MQTWIAALVAAFAGIAIGHWLRSNAAKAEKSQLERRTQELSGEVVNLRRESAQAQADSIARAGFESLAAEREKTIHRLNSEREEAQRASETQASAQREQAATVSRLEAQLKAERESAQEKLKLLTEARVELTHQFEALAGKILDEKSSKFTEQNKVNLDQLLNPLRTQITEFRGKVEEAQKDSLAGRVELRGKLESLEKLNQQLSAEAHNLTTALRGSNKAQGDWGEVILIDLLEKAGLRKNEQYSFQQQFGAVQDEDGSRKKSITDVIVSLPGGRHLIVDSKVSLNAYTDYCTATQDDQRKFALKQHLASVRSHVDGLSRRNYPKLPGLDSPDFVVMFVPVEPAFLLALQEGGDLWHDAYKRDILLVGPTSLLFVIRIVENLWRQEQQAQNVQKIIDETNKLYDKFVGFIGDLEDVGKKLQEADKSYKGALNKLSTGTGNLVGRVEKLKKLGLKTNKQLPPKLLESAGIDAEEQAELALAASSEEDNARISDQI